MCIMYMVFVSVLNSCCRSKTAMSALLNIQKVTFEVLKCNVFNYYMYKMVILIQWLILYHISECWIWSFHNLVPLSAICSFLLSSYAVCSYFKYSESLWRICLQFCNFMLPSPLWIRKMLDFKFSFWNCVIFLK